MRKQASKRSEQVDQVETYRLGEQTQEHIALFVDALGKSASIGAECVRQAIAVSESFPKWEAKSDAYKALTKGVIEALLAVGMKHGSAKGYATHFSNIVRVAQLPKVEYSVGQRKDESPILKTCTGREFFQQQTGSFTDAYHAAKVMAKQYGLTNGKGVYARTAKPQDKGQILDALDKVINAARVCSGFAGTKFVEALRSARYIATSTKADDTAAATRRRSSVLAKSNMSRGQKAAATRRANQIKTARAVEQARVVH